MASQDVQMRGDLAHDSKQWSSSKLLEISLSALSRSLSESISKQQTLSIYLDWLEVHRLNPGDLSKNWEITVMQWVIALQLRGFDKDELVNGVRKWKKDNEPFQPSPAPWPFRRYPPMPYDIVKSWPKSGYGSNAPKNGVSSYPGKSEDFSGKPPGSYICNRCGISGHFLEACPTNMDPSYDRAPSMNYCCPLCKKYGKHYKSLCPLNTDPFSIIQKRREKSIETPGEADSVTMQDWKRDKENQKDDDLLGGCDRGRSTTVDARSPAYHVSPDLEHEDDIRATSSTQSSPNKRDAEEILRRIKEIDDLKLRLHQCRSVGSIGTEDVELIRNGFDDDRTSLKRTRAASPDSVGTRFRRSINEQSPSPTKARILRNKIAAIECAEKYGTNLPTMTATNYSVERAALLAELHEEEEGNGRMDREYEVKIEDGCADDVDGSKSVPSAKRSKATCHHRGTSSRKKLSSDMDIDNKQPRSPAKPSIMKHSDFIQKLVDRRPEMKDTVNTISRRPTAWDMWNDDDDRRMKQLSIHDQKHALQSPFEDDEDDEEGQLAKYEKEIMEMDRSTDMHLDSPTFDSPLSPFVSPTYRDDMDHESDWS